MNYACINTLLMHAVGVGVSNEEVDHAKPKPEAKDE